MVIVPAWMIRLMSVSLAIISLSNKSLKLFNLGNNLIQNRVSLHNDSLQYGYRFFNIISFIDWWILRLLPRSSIVHSFVHNYLIFTLRTIQRLFRLLNNFGTSFFIQLAFQNIWLPISLSLSRRRILKFLFSLIAACIIGMNLRVPTSLLKRWF